MRRPMIHVHHAKEHCEREALPLPQLPARNFIARSFGKAGRFLGRPFIQAKNNPSERPGGLRALHTRRIPSHPGPSRNQADKPSKGHAQGTRRIRKQAMFHSEPGLSFQKPFETEYARGLHRESAAVPLQRKELLLVFQELLLGFRVFGVCDVRPEVGNQKSSKPAEVRGPSGLPEASRKSSGDLSKGSTSNRFWRGFKNAGGNWVFLEPLPLAFHTGLIGAKSKTFMLDTGGVLGVLGFAAAPAEVAPSALGYSP